MQLQDAAIPGGRAALRGLAGGHEPRGSGASRDRARGHDAGEWVAALSAILADRAGAQQLGIAGRALVERRYSLEALAPRLAGLIRRLATAA